MMPAIKKSSIDVFDSINDLWMGRWNYSDPITGVLIERALKSGRLAVKTGYIFSASVIREDLNGIPTDMCLTSVNIGEKRTLNTHDVDFLSDRVTSLLEIEPYIKMRDDAFRTINSIMRKIRTPILFNSQHDLAVTPCQCAEILDADIATVQGDMTFKNVDFDVSGSITDVIQMYHDAESILLKKLGIPATFLSRSSGMGAQEVNDASAIDDIIKQRELKAREKICSFLGITVKWALDGIKENKDGDTDVQNPEEPEKPE